jgi:hypothetical protein
MNVKRILAGIGTLALAVGLAGGLATSARASVVPVIYNDSNGWSTPQVRPAWVLIGQGGSPMAHTWYWNTWNAKDAKSTGTLWVDNCKPDCAQGATSYHKLYVTMSGIGHHHGRAYYSVMTWYTPGYRMYWNSRWSNTAVLHFRYYAPGTTSPGWF